MSCLLSSCLPRRWNSGGRGSGGRREDAFRLGYALQIYHLWKQTTILKTLCHLLRNVSKRRPERRKSGVSEVGDVLVWMNITMYQDELKDTFIVHASVWNKNFIKRRPNRMNQGVKRHGRRLTLVLTL